MRALTMLGAGCIMAVAAMPAVAADTMATMSMMQGGEVMAFMPDGHMGKMMADSKSSMMMIEMGKPIDHCTMLMMGSDGKTYMIDTSTPEAMKQCEAMAK